MHTAQFTFIFLLTLNPPFATYLIVLFLYNTLAETYTLGVAKRPYQS